MTTTPSACPQGLKNALFLCRKAGALQAGYDAVCQSLESREAVLVFMTEDVSPGTSKRLLRKVVEAVEVRVLPCQKTDMDEVFHKPVAVFSVCDVNLAKLCLLKLEHEI